MLKSVLERFIAKYNLAGSADKVTWVTDSKTLKTRFISDDKNILGIVETTEASFEKGDYAIFDTAQLRAVLSVLDEDVQITVNKKSGDRPTALVLRDADTKATFVLAEPTVIPTVPDIKSIPDYHITIALDAKFMNTFVKSKNALPEVETFTVLTETTEQTVVGTKIILGYSATQNSTRISMNIDLEDGDGLSKEISFSARYLKELLLGQKAR